MAQNQRFLACWANFFAEVPLEGLCWANFFAVSPRRRVVGRVLLRCCGLVRSRRHVGVMKAANLGARTEIRMQFTASIMLVCVSSGCCVTCVLELHAKLGEGTLLGWPVSCWACTGKEY